MKISDKATNKTPIPTIVVKADWIFLADKIVYLICENKLHIF